ncbi:FMN-binding negative transcriptional regulator [Frateuria defendens]|uniref:FMN-binding negative transcriptional regulator n=1 Tax=Frateuria defendens TaxID=2219559 RepID=UPI00066FE57D|nr:FMN-binding negative transcriptional regulator [Frateuria defendens]
MVQPRAFRETRREVLEDLVRAYPFATVAVRTADGLAANHLPLELAGEVLRGHVARGNELAKLDGAPALAIFHGPEGYVSPNWYPSKHETGREVPTWNYAVVHVHGRLRVVDDAAWLRAFLATLTERHEAGEPKPWSIDDAPADHVDKLLRAIVGIEIAVERVEGKFKLGQNHPEANRRGVIAGLQRRHRGDDAALAALTAQTLEEGI